MLYKALDVREQYVVGKAEYYKGYGCSNSGNVRVPQHLRVIVIAEESRGEYRKRVRFEFLESYEYEFQNEVHFNGYTGDWKLIIPGDHFIIEETSTYKNVIVVNTL